MLLTLSNVIYISIDVEFNYSGIVTRASPGFIVIDNMFCALAMVDLPFRALFTSMDLSVDVRSQCRSSFSLNVLG